MPTHVLADQLGDGLRRFVLLHEQIQMSSRLYECNVLVLHLHVIGHTQIQLQLSGGTDSGLKRAYRRMLGCLITLDILMLCCTTGRAALDLLFNVDVMLQLARNTEGNCAMVATICHYRN